MGRIKAGSTYNLLVKLDIARPFDEVIFTLKSDTDKQLQITKTADDYTEGTFLISLTQQETELLKGTVMIEAQINYTDKSVDKSMISYKVISPTLATTFVEGNTPTEATMEDIDIVLDIIRGDIALLITPEQSSILIEHILELFAQTKEIADDVQKRADNGEFDGKDGKDGKDYVLTEEDKEEIAGMVEGGGTTGEIILSDAVTGKKYTLSVVNGKLTMEGVK